MDIIRIIIWIKRQWCEPSAPESGTLFSLDNSNLNALQT